MDFAGYDPLSVSLCPFCAGIGYHHDRGLLHGPACHPGSFTGCTMCGGKGFHGDPTSPARIALRAPPAGECFAPPAGAPMIERTA